MKKALLIIVTIITFFSCKEETNTNDKTISLPESSGKINNISIFIDETLWNGEVGDSLRKKFAAPVDGLPQEEPLFNINQYPSKIFEGFVTKGRNIIFVEKSNQTGFLAKKNVYAYPQNVFTIVGKNTPEIIDVIEAKYAEIIKTIKATEIADNQKRMKKSLIDDKILQDKFGIKMNIGIGYKNYLVKDKFVWFMKEFTSGYNSLLVYEVPFSAIDKNENVVQNIIRVRDSIGKKNIEGVVQNTYMVTAEDYAPYLFEVVIDSKPTYLSKGTWYLKNDFMAGPFVNYAIKDNKNKRYLIVEGFTYLPSKAKRDHIFELEAIINSTKFIK